MNKRVTIIMRCKNSDWVIAEALSALFSQHFKDFELLVVDSGSTDRTLEFVSAYPCRLIEIAPEHYYPGKVLNEAVAHCNSDLIVFLNSDSVMLSPNSLGNLVSALDDENLVAAYGRQLARPEAETWVKRDYAASFPEHAQDKPSWITLSFPLAAIRQDALKQHAFYTDAWASEDTEWGEWARQMGHKIAYVPTATTMHSHNYSLKEIYGRRFVEGEADCFIFKKRPNIYERVRELVTMTANDLIFHVRMHDWRSIPSILPKRLVYQWAYFQGLKLGTQRISNKCFDTSHGQAVVLDSTVK